MDYSLFLGFPLTTYNNYSSYNFLLQELLVLNSEKEWRKLEGYRQVDTDIMDRFSKMAISTLMGERQ